MIFIFNVTSIVQSIFHFSSIISPTKLVQHPKELVGIETLGFLFCQFPEYQFIQPGEDDRRFL